MPDQVLVVCEEAGQHRACRVIECPHREAHGPRPGYVMIKGEEREVGCHEAPMACIIGRPVKCQRCPG